MSQANKSQSTSNSNNSSSALGAAAAVASTPASSSAAVTVGGKLSHPPHPSLPIPHSSPHVHSSSANEHVNSLVASTALLALTGSPHASANPNGGVSVSAQVSPSDLSAPNSATSSTASTASTTPSSAASSASTPASNVSVSAKSLHTQNSDNALWVGDLDPSVDEHMLVSGLFSAVSSSILHSKIIRDKVSGLSRGYGFIEFADRMDAERVMREYNGKEIEGSQGKRKYKLNWASGGEQEKKPNANSSSSSSSSSSSPASASPSTAHIAAADDNAIAIFIGDLSSDVSDQLLEAVFRQRYSSVVNARVVMDGVTNKSKGFGFVRFREENEARHAIETMQGTIIGSRAIRLSNATPKRNQQSSQHQHQHQQHAHGTGNQRGFNMPAGQSHGNAHTHTLLNHTRGMMMNAGGVAVIHDPENAHNNTVFVGGLDESTNSEQIREAFSSFGIILNITIPLNKGCAFVEYDNHLAAANAIGSLHQTKVGTSIIRCTWGKRNAKRGNNPNVGVPHATANGAQTATPATSAGGNFGGVFPYSHPNLIGPSAAAAAYGYDAFNTFNAYPAYAAAAAAYPSYEYLNGGQSHGQANQPDTASAAAAAAAAAFYPPFAAATAAYDPNQYNLHFPHASFAGYAHNSSAEVNPAFSNANPNANVNAAADPTHGSAAFSAAVNANVNALNERKEAEAIRQPARLVDVRAKDQILNNHHNAPRTWQQHNNRPQHHPNANANANANTNTNAQLHGHPHPRQHQHPHQQAQQHGFRGYAHHNAAPHEGTISA